jgi:hypothetical protein
LVFAAIGAMVSFALPPIMGALVSAGVFTAASVGILATLSIPHVVNTTMLFGLFGALAPVLESAYSYAFGGNDKSKAETASTPDPKQVNINIQQAPQVTQGQAMIDVDSKQHSQKIEAERMAIIAGNRTQGV